MLLKQRIIIQFVEKEHFQNIVAYADMHFVLEARNKIFDVRS